jgi:hypothetical protein
VSDGRQAPRSGARSEPQASGEPVGPRSFACSAPPASDEPVGPPPLAPFGLRLHHDARWSHGGQPILHRRLREHFDKSVVYLPGERKYAVTLRRFRGEIEVEEAAFFVRSFDAASGRIALSDRSEETLDPASLALSTIDGALLCRVKRELAPGGLLARFAQSAHAELMQAVEEGEGGLALRIQGRLHPIPDL